MGKKIFFFVFLRTGFWVPKTKFSSFFSAILSPIGLKIFLQVLWPNWSAYFFFFLWNLVSIKFGRFYKIRKIPKFKVFDKVFSILVLLTYGNDIFQNKKNTHPDWALVVTQKVSVQNNEVSSFARGKTFHRFWVLGFRKLLEGGIWEFCAYDNFCSTPQDLSTLSVLKIFAQPFLRNPGKGGGALIWICEFHILAPKRLRWQAFSMLLDHISTNWIIINFQ